MSENRELERTNEQEEGEESFAELFEESCRRKGGWLEPGQKVDGVVLKVSAEWVFIDCGQKGEGIIDRKELLDPDGNPTVREGDAISAYFLSSRQGEMRFTTRITGGAAGNAQLEAAWEAGVPVEGVVEQEIKGGYQIRLGGSTRAFCPFSQIALRRGDDRESLVGSRLTFRITDYGEKGRNIVVSRRVLLEEEQQRLREAVWASLSEGMTVNGTVSSLRDFGAFVDIGGLEGLVPLSEIGWGRVKDAAELLSVGQQVQVVVKSLDRERNRISLSIRDTLVDPWEQVGETCPEGSLQSGTVARLANFGAFVTLPCGLDGLIHISKLGGGKRINHPRELLGEGENVEVKIESIDRDNRRISLALAGVARAADEESATLEEFRARTGAASGGMGTLGDALRARSERRGKKR
jgi:small subunit ribosomal protein S1